MTPITAPCATTTSPARYDGLVARARELRGHLPWNAIADDDFRALAVWSRARGRIAEAHTEALMAIFTDLEDITPPPVEIDPLGRKIPSRFLLRDLGTAMAAFFAVAAKIDPLVARLEQGLRLMAQTPFSTEGDRTWRDYADLWIGLRGQARDLLHELYLAAVEARALYLRMDDAGKAQAEARWGPIKDKTRDAHNAMALIKATWPADKLRRLDDSARQEGIYLIEREGDAPWLTHERQTPPGKSKKQA